MASAERVVATWMASARDEEIEKIVSGTPPHFNLAVHYTEKITDISNDRITLLDVVKSLGEYLTSEDDALRTKGIIQIPDESTFVLINASTGVEFLSLVLSSCPTEKLNRQSVRVLATFYCGKLDDTETMIPALKGLNTLTTLPTCSSTEATSIIEA
ncbi:hypothetical protein DXG03_009462 [Asterophora parasitica]|uniref:MMS19 nucleotide excision repair protein n=1 Tax=Asterophora parasitica TaxID=117018 RepID=A0A9P7GDW2_9AGAR|nr:hypothetical protein DXG03_009462 [Asterophora parasitica]